MASSVEKEVGAAGAGAAVDVGAGAGADAGVDAASGEEPLSLELPAPSGWKKKVSLLIPCSSFFVDYSFFWEFVLSRAFCLFLLEFLWVSFVFVICFAFC